jgi:hypothetical protein
MHGLFRDALSTSDYVVSDERRGEKDHRHSLEKTQQHNERTPSGQSMSWSSFEPSTPVCKLEALRTAKICLA